MQQILINTIQNAIKFSPKKAHIIVTVETRFEGLKVNADISIQDFGIGICAADMSKLFQPFFKTQSQQSADLNPSSHGLGIHISKQIALGLGGDLTATSEVGKGTIFKLSLGLEIVEVVLKPVVDDSGSDCISS